MKTLPDAQVQIDLGRKTHHPRMSLALISDTTEPTGLTGSQRDRQRLLRPDPMELHEGPWFPAM